MLIYANNVRILSLHQLDIFKHLYRASENMTWRLCSN